MATRPRANRLGSFDRDFDVFIDESLGDKARQKILVDYARDAKDAADAQNRTILGRVPEHKTTVDGALGAPIEAVKPEGTIFIEYQLIESALVEIAAMLAKHSPVKTGRFRASHVMFADGVEADPASPPPAKEYAFINVQPYARKIERGLSPQAPEGVFHVVSVLASRRYGNLARITFGYRSIPAGAAVSKWAQTPKAQALARRVRGGNPARHQDWLTRQPAVVVRVA